MHSFDHARFATRAIHVGQKPDPATGATVPPIYLSSTFTQESPAVHKGYEYSRSHNPTRLMFEEVLSSLEGGQGCCAFASGCAATTTLLMTLKPGDEVLTFGDVYGGTFRILKRVLEGWGLKPLFTDDVSSAAFKTLVTPRTKMLWVETPTNPLLRVLDIAALAQVAHEAGAVMVVDSTFGTPVLQTPLKLGADYVLHSTTKYIGGHSDLVGGAVIVRQAGHMEQLKFLQNAMGGVPGPFDCYLSHRGIKTLAVRMERHVQNALALARRFEKHPALALLSYPFLESHPDHATARKQMCGGGGMVTIVLKQGWEAAKRFCERLRVFSLAESLGGVESLCCHPASMTHASIPKEIREKRGVTDGLVRLSVGIEAVEDLIADVEQALT